MNIKPPHDILPEPEIPNPDRHRYVRLTNEEEALLEFYRRLRPGEPPSVDNAKNLIDNLFFNPSRLFSL